ncbi:hypothetical protein KFK09_010326 [Dendrobium nobile]|uniref:Uncharacterized protein n=1 Tax=Dendrobium nobile TaxID=94219 RepID=A0A8T3BLW3_DENNO|nr:hypothetical protein KFK09_010326 [Dendrobium nobile]
MCCETLKAKSFGKKKSKFMRVHLDWLQCLSVSSSESSGDEDPENDFALQHDKPVVSVASRGRARGRGRRDM